MDLRSSGRLRRVRLREITRPYAKASVWVTYADSNSIRLAWNCTETVESFTLLYKRSGETSYSEVYTGNANAFSHTALSLNSVYRYIVKAKTAAGLVESEPVEARTSDNALVIGDYALGGYYTNLSAFTFYRYGSYSGNLVLTAPVYSNVLVDGYFTLKGTNLQTAYSNVAVVLTNLFRAEPSVWITITNKGYFEEKVFLRQGSGLYKMGLLVGPMASGSYYYAAIVYISNQCTNDIRYITPSVYVQSLDTSMQSLAKSITTGKSTARQQALSIHDEMVVRIRYDVESYNAGVYPPQDAIAVWATKKAVCAGYSYLYAALCRSLGIPTKVIHGIAKSSTATTWPTDINHAWNEVYFEGAWHIVDVTWDDPLVGGHSDYTNGQNLRWTYFDIPESQFYDTHTNWMVKPYGIPEEFRLIKVSQE